VGPAPAGPSAIALSPADPRGTDCQSPDASSATDSSPSLRSATRTPATPPTACPSSAKAPSAAARGPAPAETREPPLGRRALGSAEGPKRLYQAIRRSFPDSFRVAVRSWSSRSPRHSRHP